MNIIQYLREVKLELAKVTWPSQQDSLKLTYVVVGASLLVGIYVGGLDVAFTSLLGLFIK